MKIRFYWHVPDDLTYFESWTSAAPVMLLSCVNETIINVQSVAKDIYLIWFLSG